MKTIKGKDVRYIVSWSFERKIRPEIREVKDGLRNMIDHDQCFRLFATQIDALEYMIERVSEFDAMEAENEKGYRTIFGAALREVETVQENGTPGMYKPGYFAQ